MDFSDRYLPRVNEYELVEEKFCEVKGEFICPCCSYKTIPNDGYNTAYICPVCFWEMDFSIKGESEPSDQNHGLILEEARENYKKFKAIKEEFILSVREPKEDEK